MEKNNAIPKHENNCRILLWNINLKIQKFLFHFVLQSLKLSKLVVVFSVKRRIKSYLIKFVKD